MSEAKITKKDIEHLKKLARVEFGEKEEEIQEDDENQDAAKKTAKTVKFVKKASVLVVTVADDGDVCVSRLKF